jgi:hypothetical protein
MLRDPYGSLNLEKIIDRLVFIPVFEENSVKLSIQMNVFDNLMRKINAHLLVYPRDLIDTTLPEGFLMWKMYYFFYLRLNNDSSELESKDKIYKFKLTGMTRILKKYYKYLFD